MSDNPAVEPETTNADDAELRPTDETAVTQEALQPGQDVENAEKPEQSEESESNSEVETTQYLELDGKEYSLDEVRLMRDERLMQKDYTKKTTAHSVEVKKDRAEIAVDRERLTDDRAKVDDMSVKLEALVLEDDAIDWSELKEDDPEEYIRLKEKADKRKAMIEQIKADRDTPTDDPVVVAEEQRKLVTANPEWLDKDGKTTTAYNEDVKLINDHLNKKGYSALEIKNMTRAHYMVDILQSAKYEALQEKGREINAKREKVPLVTKPKANKTNSQPKTAAEVWFPNSVG